MTAAVRSRPQWLAPAATAAGAIGATVLVALTNPARTGLVPACPLKSMTGLDCPLCGSTRAAYRLVTGDLLGAADLNVLFVLALPLLVWAWVRWAARSPLRWPGRSATFAAVGVFLAFGVFRNLPVAPFDLLHS